MIIDILTLFPNFFDNFKTESIIKRAINNNKVIINIHNIRDYATNKHKQVDDYPYGGGAGMVLMCEPIFNAIENLRKDNTKVIMMSPSGKTFNQEKAYSLSKEEHIILLCGHYEGFDERIKTIIDEEISIGNFVLTGGEIPAMAIVDAVTRLLPGVISKDSLKDESFNNNLLDYPTYTKPADFRGSKVPEVLLSGHHKNIEKFREEERLKKTIENRKDLLEGDNNG